MPNPQINARAQNRERPTYNELIWTQLQDTKTEVKETRKELNARMDRIEKDLDRVKERMDKLDEKVDKLADKIDDLRKDIVLSGNHGNIMTASVIGIALSVIYAVFFK